MTDTPWEPNLEGFFSQNSTFNEHLHCQWSRWRAKRTHAEPFVDFFCSNRIFLWRGCCMLELMKLCRDETCFSLSTSSCVTQTGTQKTQTSWFFVLILMLFVSLFLVGMSLHYRKKLLKKGISLIITFSLFVCKRKRPISFMRTLKFITHQKTKLLNEWKLAGKNHCRVCPEGGVRGKVRLPNQKG